jgi:hypothetical protein
MPAHSSEEAARLRRMSLRLLAELLLTLIFFFLSVTAAVRAGLPPLLAGPAVLVVVLSVNRFRRWRSERNA